MLFYVNDTVFTGNAHDLMSQATIILIGQFMIKDLEPLKYFISIKISGSTADIQLNENKYSMDFVIDVGLINAKFVQVPTNRHHELTG